MLARVHPSGLLFATLCALSCSFCPAAPPGDPTKRDIPTLVQQLGADTRAERDEASGALEKIGAAALPELRKAITSKDAEIRRRAKRLVEKIELTVFGEQHCFSAHSGSVNGVAFSPDGKRAASADSRAVRLWDLGTHKLLARSERHGDRVMAVAFSPDGKLLATGSEDRTVRLWDAGTLREVRVCRGHRADVRAVAFSAGGKRLLSAGFDGHIREWEVATGAAGRTVGVRGRGFFAVLPLGDGGGALASGRGSDAVECYDLQTGAARPLLVGHHKPVMGFALARDGKTAVTASHDTTVRVWDVSTGKCLHTLKGHAQEVTSVALSPDGALAVSGSLDRMVRVWDVAAGRAIREMRGHEGPVWSVAVSPDGKRALSGGNDGTMRLWAIGP